MASFNKVILAGNLTRDPEMRSLPSGMSVTRICLAVNRVYTSKDGEKKEEVTYVDIDSFGKPAETIAKYCKKGSGILVEGTLKLDQWEDKVSGEKRSRMGVVLENFTFLGGKSSAPVGSDTSYDDSAPPSRPSFTTRTTPPPANDGIEEDVPF